MCSTCGCANSEEARVTLFPGHDRAVLVQHEHGVADKHGPHEHGPHEHGPHEHGPHEHGPHELDAARTIVLERQVLAKNDLLAEDNRRWLGGRLVLAVNIMSSPGSGKTTLLERTIHDVGEELGISVIEGDQETPLDAQRIQAVGRPVAQVNTGAGCHLDADMVRRALAALDPGIKSTVFIENVGNLVCPALFDLGETYRVVVASVTEGADKPLKYPHMFRNASLVLVNKLDLAPYVDFDQEVFVAATRAVNPGAEIVTVSATRGDGLADWYGWLRSRRLQPTTAHD